MLLHMGGRGPTVERSLRGLCVGGDQLLRHLLGFWFLGGFPEAASLMEVVRPPAGQTEQFNKQRRPEATFTEGPQDEDQLLKIMFVSV